MKLEQISPKMEEKYVFCSILGRKKISTCLIPSGRAEKLRDLHAFRYPKTSRVPEGRKV